MDESKAQSMPEPGWVETATSKRIMAVLSYSHQAQDIGVIYGGAGVGKTTAARHYTAGTGETWLCTMSPDVSKAAGALEQACRAMGTQGALAAARSKQAILDKLADRNALLIVDEAQHLTVEALECFRAIYDASRIGLVLMGNAQVYARLTGGRRDAVFAQLFSRIGLRLALSRALKSDAEQIAVAWGVSGKAEITFLSRIAQAHGALRLMVKTLREAHRSAGGAPLTLDHLQAAWARLGGES